MEPAGTVPAGIEPAAEQTADMPQAANKYPELSHSDSTEEHLLVQEAE